MGTTGASLRIRIGATKRGRLGAAACCVALLAVLLPSLRLEPATAAPSPNEGPETILLFGHPVPLADAGALLSASGLQPVSFEHTGSRRGGFQVGGLPLDDALASYRRAFAATRGGETEPQVFSVRVVGEVDAARSDELQPLVVAARVVEAGQPAVVIPVDPQNRRGKTVTSSSARKKRLWGLDRRPAFGKEWVPSAGTITGYEDGIWRIITNTLWWADQSQLQSFGETGGYEHNFVLLDPGNTDGSLRPFCDTVDDFWAQRSFVSFWDSTFPDAAGPYLDTGALDACSKMDLTIGVYRPQFLSAGVGYITVFGGLGGPTAQSSPFDLGAQRVPRNCDLPVVHVGINHPLCAGLVDTPISDFEPLIPDRGRCSVPIPTKSWTSGSEGSCVVNTHSVVSRGLNQTQGDSSSYVASRTEDSISRGGRYVVFESFATNLVEGDTNGRGDVFVRDTVTDQVERVSVSSAGEQGNNSSFAGSISSDGRYVTFESHASNLAPGNTEKWGSDVFLHDTYTGETRLVSVNSSGVEGNRPSTEPAVSDDGRYVVFLSEATDLIPRTSTSGFNIFVRDMVRGRTTKVAPTWAGGSSISGDGRYIVFSTPLNLSLDDRNGVEDIYRYEIASGTFAPVSVSSSGVFGNWDSDDPSISRDGRYVAFQSYASNLAPTTTSPEWRRWTSIYLRDMVTGTTRRVSVNSLGAESNSDNFNSDLSDDGRYVVFETDATNLVPEDLARTWDVFVHDIVTGETKRVTSLMGVDAPNEYAENPGISPDGSWIVFDSQGSHLLPVDSNGRAPDVFIAPRP